MPRGEREGERRVWLAVVYPIGHAGIFGGGWDRDRLHWTREAAEREALEMASDLGLSPIDWTEITEVWAIGRCHKIDCETDLYGVTVRGVRLPTGRQEDNMRQWTALEVTDPQPGGGASPKIVGKS
jgi:hypothetical protein